MEGPFVAAIPPALHYIDPSPVSTTRSSPDLTQLPSLERERGSSETAIFSIYSMYGGEVAKRSHDKAEVVTDLLAANGVSNAYASNQRHSIYKQSPRSTNSDTPYYDTSSSDSRVSSQYASAADLPPRSTSVTTNGSVQLAYLDDRSLSTHASSSALRISPHKSSDTLRSSKLKVNPSRPNSTAQVSCIVPDPELQQETRVTHLRQPVPTRSRTPSNHRISSTGSLGTQARPLPTPPPQPIRTPELLSPPSLHLSSPSKIPPTPNIPGSKISLVPSEGENIDAFHVRSTYAELEMTGVKGDGYEEGVERTRARAAGSRASQLRADEALGDGSEKTRELSSKEVETLAGLDRYGFFSIPSHDRLILLNSAPFTKRLSKVPPGPKNAPHNAKSLPALPPTATPPKETSRIAKWDRMMEARGRDQGGNIEAWGIKASKEQKLRERVYKGIPDRWRSAAWDLLMGRFSFSGRRETLVLGEQYRDTLDKPSTYDVQIDLDVPRTISGHIMFRTRYGSGQRSLFHVLHSFSLRCEECGYVQGMGPIAATLLCYFEPERVYASLVRLHVAYGMHTIFSPGFPGLLEAIYVQERITEQMMPNVYAAFKTLMISTTSYATKWYITLFANSVPFQTQLRLWDVFLLEGQDVYVAIAVAIVWVYRDNITSAAANFETVLSLLSSFFVPEDDDALLSWIGRMLGDKKLRASMIQWRHEWQNLVATGKEGTALL